MTDSRICACGCGKVFYRKDMGIRQWSHRKYYSKRCKSKMGTRRRRERFKNSGFVMADYTKPSPEAAQVANCFLYKQKPWIIDEAIKSA